MKPLPIRSPSAGQLHEGRDPSRFLRVSGFGHVSRAPHEPGLRLALRRDSACQQENTSVDKSIINVIVISNSKLRRIACGGGVVPMSQGVRSPSVSLVNTPTLTPAKLAANQVNGRRTADNPTDRPPRRASSAFVPPMPVTGSYSERGWRPPTQAQKIKRDIPRYD
jgi:hypothetical protein